ncbi:DUF6318 family protein [Geodermatophilus sp. SYSU D00705]
MDDVARRTTLRLAAGLAAGVALLGGCSEKQEASDTLPSADATQPSEAELPSLGPAEFPVPDEAREKTPEGALAFTRYYIDLNGYIADGPRDPQPLLDLSQSCRQCRQVVQSYTDDRAAGYAYRDFSYTFLEAGPGLLEGDTAQVGFVYEQGPFTVLDTSGQQVTDRSTAATGKLQSGTMLKWDESLSTWIVTELTIG